MENERKETAEFNMAISYLNRLNALFYYVNASSMDLDIEGWMHGLITLFRELSPYMNEKELKSFQEKKEEMNQAISQTMQKYKRTGRIEIQPETYDLLHNYELELRKILKTSGLQMKMKEDATFAIR